MSELIQIDGSAFLIEQRPDDWFVTCPEWPSFWAVGTTREQAIERAAQGWRRAYAVKGLNAKPRT